MIWNSETEPREVDYSSCFTSSSGKRKGGCTDGHGPPARRGNLPQNGEEPDRADAPFCHTKHTSPASYDPHLPGNPVLRALRPLPDFVSVETFRTLPRRWGNWGGFGSQRGEGQLAKCFGTAATEESTGRPQGDGGTREEEGQLSQKSLRLVVGGRSREFYRERRKEVAKEEEGRKASSNLIRDVVLVVYVTEVPLLLRPSGFRTSWGPRPTSASGPRPSRMWGSPQRCSCLEPYSLLRSRARPGPRSPLLDRCCRRLRPLHPALLRTATEASCRPPASPSPSH